MSELMLEKNIDSFNNDTNKFGGYVYTNTNRLSALISNQHITDTILDLVDTRDKNVIDVGCGDGTYSIETLRQGKPKMLFGFDPSIGAIRSAREKAKSLDNISFSTGNIYTYTCSEKFDIAILRGVLHHLYQPEKAIAQVAKYANKIIIAEPNGYNPVLKIIEKVSKYHREHEEKSYSPFLLNHWVKKHGGTITTTKYTGTVPFFCPDHISKWLKSIEPFIERLQLINMLVCGSYYVVYDINQ